MYKKFKQTVYRILIPILKIISQIEWKYFLANADEIKLVVGAGMTHFPGWFNTDIDTLDLTKEADFQKYFSKRKIDKVLAEHVLEHLTDNQLDLMCSNLYKYSSSSVNIRIAVPDGFHSSHDYINKVKPGGTGMGADDHKHLFNFLSLAEKFTKHGFKANPIEYWDEDHIFHQGYANDDKGFITRSFINDDRNKNGEPVYTSLIIDFTKK